jgi:hypothetical protein
MLPAPVLGAEHVTGSPVRLSCMAREQTRASSVTFAWRQRNT